MRRPAFLAALLAAVAAAPAEARIAASTVQGPFAPSLETDAGGVTTGTVGRGRLEVVPGRSERSGPGPLRRYVVEVEGGIRIDRRAFADSVYSILSHRRSWGGTGRVSFQRVGSARRAQFRVTLATRRTTDRLCYPLVTRGLYSCAQGDRAVLNLWRWRNPPADFGRRLARYRAYMVNHEVGHLLGHGHRGCPRAGALAPVMMQQTKGVAPCRPNGWPRPYERG